MKTKLDFEQRHRANVLMEHITNGGDIEEIVFEFIAVRDSYNEIRNKLKKFILKHGFSTGHGETTSDLLDELDWQMTDRNSRLAIWKRISEAIRTADNSMEYSYKHVIFNGVDIGTVGNLLVEMTPLPAKEKK